MKRIVTFLAIIALLLTSCTQQVTFTDDQITEYWTSGKTLPVQVSEQFPLPEQKIETDLGYNVLVDLAHQCNFANLWTLPEQLNKLGYRAVGSHATLNSALDPDGESRIRIVWDTVNKINPFSWFPNPEYHVIITTQGDPNAQVYLQEEIDATVKFVDEGGSIMIRGNFNYDKVPIMSLIEAFGLELTADVQKSDFGKGRILLCGDPNEGLYPRNATDDQKDSVDLVMAGYLDWLTENQSATKQDAGLPEAMWGGGGIYPELEENFSGIVLYYAANQKEELLKTVREDIPKAQEFILERLPSTPTLEPMYLILCAGSGGGWAVNAYRPKENGIISLDPYGIISIFAHELAHTMHGPANADGNVAGISPIPNRGEAHAGWFQGKVNALFKEDIHDQSNRNCNSMFDWDPNGNELDLATEYENEAGRQKWGKGKDWTKTWYLWQKLDDRYGPTWYPRWKYVQHTRWKHDPEHRLSWDEMVEDMSIAVGEDLFPFMIKLGTTLYKERLEEIEYEGKVIKLPVAPIEVTPGGPVRIEEIDDPSVL